MPAQTFRDVWSKVALHASTAPVSLVQSWVQDAYDTLLGKRHWAFLRREFLLTTLASRAVTVTFTQGDRTVTSAGGFVATDAGRQIRLPNGPVYTIDTFTNANEVELLELYAETSGAAAATISDIYLAMPEDFRSFEDVVDLTIQRPIAWWISKERLDLFDPARIASDTRLRVLASHNLSQRTATLGRVLYEAWPHPTAAGTYLVHYFKRSDRLADEDTFQGVLATYTLALQQGALAQAAMWPGTESRKNPYFNLPLARELQAQFLNTCNMLNIMDDDQYLQDLAQVDLAKFGLAAISADTSLLRESDATLADYY